MNLGVNLLGHMVVLYVTFSRIAKLVFTLVATFCSERTKCNNILLQVIFDLKGHRELLCMNYSVLHETVL